MRIDRSHRRWIVVTGILVAAASTCYVRARLDPLRPPSGGDAYGLAFGAAGTLCMLIAAGLTLRKRFKNLRLGGATAWMSAHVWLSVLSLPLLLFHCDFRFGGTLSSWLLALFLICWFSGLLGLVLQNVLPRVMTAQVQKETPYEQIDHVVAGLLGSAKGHVELLRKNPEAAPLVTFFDEQVAPWLDPCARHSEVFESTSAAALRRTHLLRMLPVALAPTMNVLFELSEERRQLARQRTLHLWLHGWLFVHVPIAWATLAVTVFHAIRTLRHQWWIS